MEDLIVDLNGLSYMEESELRFMLDCAWNLRGEEDSFVPVKDLKTAVVNGKLLYDREVIGVTIMDSIGCSDEYVGSYLVVVVK